MNYACLAAALLFPTVAFASPATQPVAVGEIPVPPARVAAAQPAHIAVFPFVELADAPGIKWISTGVQQSLATGISRLPGFSCVTLDSTVAPATTDAARTQARQAGADTLLFGSYQFAGDTDVRLIAQLIDVSTGRSLGGLKASGTVRDLFQLEDQLDAQVRAILMPPAAAGRPGVAAGDPAVFNGQFSTMPQGQLNQLAANVPVYNTDYHNYYYNYNTYNYPGGYGYGGYGYGYGGYGFGVGYGNGYGFGNSGFPGSVIIINNNHGHTPVISSGPGPVGHVIYHGPPTPGRYNPGVTAAGYAAR